MIFLVVAFLSLLSSVVFLETFCSKNLFLICFCERILRKTKSFLLENLEKPKRISEKILKDYALNNYNMGKLEKILEKAYKISRKTFEDSLDNLNRFMRSLSGGNSKKFVGKF